MPGDSAVSLAEYINQLGEAYTQIASGEFCGCPQKNTALVPGGVFASRLSKANNESDRGKNRSAAVHHRLSMTITQIDTSASDAALAELHSGGNRHTTSQR